MSTGFYWTLIFRKHQQEAPATKAQTDFFNAFEGALIFNYLGHGGEDGLSSEQSGKNLTAKI
jgi:hypothetical protein